MSITLVADPGGTKGIVQINGVDKLEVNADGSIVALDPVSGVDTTAGRLLQVGDFGIGVNVPQTISGTDLDDLLVNGIYRGNNLTNAPHPVNYHTIVVHSGDPGKLTQTAIGWSENRMWIRRGALGVWTDWALVYNQSNILGTVSESSGVPTGAIIETGSNANGTYIKFADGTLICRLRISTATQVVNNAVTNITGLYRSITKTWTLPATFIDTTGSAAVEMSRSSDDGIETWGAVRDVSTIAVSYRLYANISSSTLGSQIFLQAIGRWF